MRIVFINEIEHKMAAHHRLLESNGFQEVDFGKQWFTEACLGPCQTYMMEIFW